MFWREIDLTWRARRSHSQVLACSKAQEVEGTSHDDDGGRGWTTLQGGL